MLVEAGAGVVLGQHAFEARVVALDGDHEVVRGLADGGLLGAGLEVRPAGIGGHPENILRLVFIRILGIRALVIPLPGEELGAVFLEGVGDVFQENQAKDDVLVLPRFARPAGSLRLAISASLRLRRVHVVAQLVGGEPELGLEAEIGG